MSGHMSLDASYVCVLAYFILFYIFKKSLDSQQLQSFSAFPGGTIVAP